MSEGHDWEQHGQAPSGGSAVPSPATAPRYRADIDGLRAIAVGSVVLFHIDRNWLPGGFAGVDVFFVISGYLITSIVYREVLANRFSIAGFYERRIRRIYPALLATLAAVTAAGVVIFMPDELRDLGMSIVSTVAFSSNILFWLQTDYFAGPAEFKPLLHTWSLAVEEQFYIVLPPLLAMLHRFAPRSLKPVIVALALASFAASCAWVWIDPSGNYFLPHTRAWELLVGSLLALDVIPRVRGRVAAEVTGIAALVAMACSFLFLNDGSPFPAWNALPICLATGALIHIGRDTETAAARLLSLKPLVWIGLISFSVYLIHWPLIAFARYWLLRDLTAGEGAAVIVATLALAWLSWRFVEQPFRHGARDRRRRLFAGAALASGALAAAGAFAIVTNGLPQRLGDRAHLAKRDDTQVNQMPHCFLRADWHEWNEAGCYIVPGRPGEQRTLLWGDSHANHYISGIRSRAGEIANPILLYASAGCPPVIGVDVPKRPFCRGNNDQALAVIRRLGIRRVILSAYWERVLADNGLSMADVGRTVQRLRAMGVSVDVIGDNPDFAFSNPQFLAIRLSGRDDPNAPFYAPVRNSPGFNDRLRAATAPSRFFDPMALLCRGDRCLAYEGGELLMRDNSHLSSYGSNRVARAIPFLTGR